MYPISPILATNVTGANTSTPSTTTVKSLVASVLFPFLLFHKLFPDTFPAPNPVAVVFSISMFAPLDKLVSISIAAFPATASLALNVVSLTANSVNAVLVSV